MLNFYLYSISAISLSAFYVATLVVVGQLLSLALGAPVSPLVQAEIRQTLADGLGFLVVSLPLWWLHWNALRRQFRQAAGSVVAWHRFYLFTVVCLNVVIILVAGSLGITGLIRQILGVGPQSAGDLARNGVFLTSLVLSLALWWHHWSQFRGGPGELQPPDVGQGEPNAPASASWG